MKKLFGQKWDDGGIHGSSGTVCEDIAQKILTDYYFAKSPPKSTGREYFSEQFLAEILKDCQSISNNDIIATITEITVRFYEDFGQNFQTSRRNKIKNFVKIRVQGPIFGLEFYSSVAPFRHDRLFKAFGDFVPKFKRLKSPEVAPIICI